MLEHEAKARDTLVMAGFYAPTIIFDGRIRRFGKNKSQWCMFLSDAGEAWGAFGDWRTGEKHSFSSKSNKEMSHQERAAYTERKKKLERAIAAERRKKAEEAVKKAAYLLDNLCNTPHPYIHSKQVNIASRTGVYKGAFIVPVYVNQELSGAQLINGDGKKKRFVTGTLKAGGYFPIGDFSNPSRIIIAEGYATAMSLYMATGDPCVVAFDAYNLVAVAKYVRKAFPASTIILAADNDKSETGINKANEAATACSGIVRLCPIQSDFNDLHVAQGLNAVLDVIFPPQPVTAVNETIENYEKPMPNRMPFRILGRAAKKCYYLLADGQVYEHSPAAHNKQILLALAPLEFWVSMFSDGKNGFITDEAISWLLRQSERVTYDYQNVRGRGAWIDNDRIIVHQGQQIYDVAARQEYETDDFETEYLYPRGAAINAKHTQPMTAAESLELYNMFLEIPTETTLQRQLLAGWIVCSQLCGVLNWRPHIWLTGSKSTGKSWITEKIMQPLMGRNVLFVQSSTTEAGIRQSLGADALPVLFDEAEGNTERSRGNIQRVLELARQASSTSGGVIAKGSQSGDAVRYMVRSCFCFSSIIDGVMQNSDKSRITSIEINKTKYGSDEQFQRLLNHKQALTKQKCDAFYWRVIGMADVIKHNAAVFADLLSVKINDSRAGEQLGALCAGIAAYCRDSVITPAQAQVFIDGMDWSEYAAQYAEQDDAEGCLSAIMSYHIEHNDKRETIGRLLQRVVNLSSYDDDFKAINQSLAVYGLRLFDNKKLYVANKNERLRQLLKDTPYAVGWDKVLARLQGAEKTVKTISFFTYSQRSVAIDIQERFSD
jgi:putative DNA primase/helicase